ncbi:hypothetical protein [Oceanobacillus kimchii]|uniref:Uncharacterized protein n=1 Tax=Oceanobacillus kimchii TaxID=746691 RepID=A0ABQ5TKS4_9BACI|nr:hypothetical protein [Oceanobacillus kimchii]GLO66184.1 hypothetical protein MACH08_19680 [Oceanobacillus kimchii]
MEDYLRVIDGKLATELFESNVKIFLIHDDKEIIASDKKMITHHYSNYGLIGVEWKSKVLL